MSSVKMISEAPYLVSAINLLFRFEQGSRRTRYSVVPKLKLRSSQLTVILGPNGCGKSSLCKTFSQIETPTMGDLRFSPGVKPLLVWQSKELFPTTVERNLLLVGAKDAEINGIFERLRLEPLRHKNVADISGGEQQRLSLARSMIAAKNRRVVIFDEPSQDLDPQFVKVAVEMMKEMVTEWRLSVVVVTHSADLLFALGEIPGCHVAAYEQIRDFPTGLSEKYNDIFALHEAVPYSVFLRVPHSPFGAKFISLDNSFGVHSTAKDLTLHDLCSVEGMSLHHDLVFVEPSRLRVSADDRKNKGSWLKVAASSPIRHHQGLQRISRTYSPQVGNENLLFTVAATRCEELPDNGYLTLEGPIDRRSPDWRRLHEIVRDTLTSAGIKDSK